MKKRILFVEDSGSVFEMLKSKLDSSYEIERVRAVDEAIGAEEEEGPFDCYIVDLQILAFGLTLSEMSDYQDREGYAFVKEYLLKDKTDEEIRKLKSKIIICSRYVLDLKKEYRNEIEGLILVDKTKGFEKKIASLINKICNDEKEK